MKNNRFPVKDLCISAVIAALYAALTLLFAPISYGEIQCRVSEAMTILPVFFPQAIPGLTLGCVLANLLGGATVWDVVFGSLATLIAALWTRKWRSNIWLAMLPPVLCNGVIVGLVLYYVAGAPLLLTMLTVALGEAVAVYALGSALYFGMKKSPALMKLADKRSEKV